MNNRGIVHILPLIIIPVIIVAIVGSIFYQSYRKNSKEEYSTQDESIDESTSFDTPENNETDFSSETPTPLVTQKPTSTPKTTIIYTSTPVPTTPSSYGTCQVITLAGSNPNEVILTYGLTSSGGRYMKEARWDLDNDGQWDHGFSSANARVTSNLTAGSSKNVRLQLKLNDDTLSDVCTKSVTALSGTWVTIWGYVFSDDNCNSIKDGAENGISGVPVRITKTSDWSTYATTNTDGGGKFSYTTLLNSLIEMTVNMTSPSGYKSHPTHVVLSSLMGYGKNTNVQKDIPQVPYASVGQCSF